MPVAPAAAASVAVASTTGAATLGLLARAGRVPARLRWMHHALYAVSVLATAVSVRSSQGAGRRLAAVVALGVLAGLSLTRPGSARHVAAGAGAVSAVLAMRAPVPPRKGRRGG